MVASLSALLYRGARFLSDTARVRLGTLAVFIVSLAVGAAIVWGVEQTRVLREQRAVADQAAHYGGMLRLQVIRASSVTYALAAMLRQGEGEIPAFEALALTMIPIYGAISSLDLAPGGVISEIVPLPENEAAVGRRLLVDPPHDQEAREALETRQLMIAGPFDLVQGGVGLTARLPVFLADQGGEERFWGFVSAVMRVENLAASARLSDLKELGYRYAVWRNDPDTGQRQVFLSADSRPLSNPVVQVVKMPTGRWMIGVEPVGGWGSPITLVIGGSITVLLASLIAALAHKQLKQPLLLRREVQLRTEQLAEANRELNLKLSELEAAQNHLRKLSRVIEQSPVSVEITDRHGVIEYVNPMFAEVTGYSAAELQGKPAKVLQSGFTQSETYRDLWATLHSGREWRGEIQNRKKSGELFWESEVISPLVNARGEVTNYVAVKMDVTERKRAQEELERLNRELNFQANHDQLTGLANRTLLHERLTLAIAHGRRSAEALAVLMLDLDRFKAVNDNLGHEAGDRLLCEVAKRLTDCVRAEDTVARMGGDEFAVVMTAVGVVSDVVGVAQKIVERVSQPVRLAGRDAYVGASIGISLFPKDAADPATLLKQADIAMYQAKQGGRNGFRFYAQEMNVRADQRLELENSLRDAVSNAEFDLYYQPKIDLASGQIKGAEALLRWKRNGAGWVAPEEFLPVAEDTGLILPLGDWVLRTACNTALEWQKAGLACDIAVNLTARQFHSEGLIDEVRSVLGDTGLAPCCLELEVSESTTTNHPEAAIEIFRALKALGVRVSLEDFGTGLSHLSQLTRFPLDALKIDQSFVHRLTSDPRDAAAASAILALAQKLEFDVIAEGVETEEQLRFLKARGYRHVQGYYLGRPLTKEEFLLRLAA